MYFPIEEDSYVRGAKFTKLVMTITYNKENLLIASKWSLHILVSNMDGWRKMVVSLYTPAETMVK